MALPVVADLGLQSMKWTLEAEEAVKKVPFFVRKKVKTRVEKEAARDGKDTVTIAEVNATQKRFLSGMASEVRGYRIETCFGPNGCPNRACVGDRLLEQIETFMKKEDLLGFLKRHVQGGLKFHHEFRITLADCPNACSQPQIKDIGIIGALTPKVTDEPCTRCEACIDTCKEGAITLDPEKDVPHIDMQRCLACGQCIDVCPTGTLGRDTRGFRVQLGGKLGRHPRLGRELPGIFSEDKVMRIVKDCVAFYKANSTNGRRFAVIFKESDFQELIERYRNNNHR